MMGVAVHCGAGNHAKHKENAYKALMKAACASAVRCADPTDACRQAIMVLEDDQVTNAGSGSALNLDGQVECDASIMEGVSGAFGSVAAAPGIRNPIAAAYLLAKDSLAPLSCGRVRPMTLCGSGARAYAAYHGLDTSTENGYLVSQEAQNAWKKFTGWVHQADHQQQQQQQQQLQQHEQDPKQQQWQQQGSIIRDAETLDTVGAITWDAWGRISAGVSSGGVPLKLPGRVGEAALFGVGCWATHVMEQQVCRGEAGSSSSGAGGKGVAMYSSKSSLCGCNGKEAGMPSPRAGAHPSGSVPLPPQLPYRGTSRGIKRKASGNPPALQQTQPCLSFLREHQQPLEEQELEGESQDDLSQDLGVNARHGTRELVSIGVSVTGLGECVSRESLSRACASSLEQSDLPADEAISECVRRCVDRWPKTATLPDCGVLAIRVTRENGSHQQVPTMLHAEIIAVHSSPSMGIAFCQAKDQASNASGKVKAEILRNQLIHQQAKWPLGVFGSSMSWNYPNAKDG